MTGQAGALPRAVPKPVAASAADPGAHWDASLVLKYARRNDRTVLIENRHAGPLVVQKALYPEGDGHCQTVILHPPGGIAGGDRLSIDVDAGRATEVLLTTPGATRWYKSNGKRASQVVRIVAAAGAVVEWMPLETIVFDRADALATVRVEMNGDAQVAGCEIIGFGRSAYGERFGLGRFRQSVEIRRDGKLLWAEYGDVAGADPLFESPIGYAGRTVSGLLWVAGSALCNAADAPRAAAIPAAPGNMLAGVTRLPDGIMLARALGSSTEQVRQWLIAVWSAWRPHYAGRAASVPRLWAT